MVTWWWTRWWAGPIIISNLTPPHLSHTHTHTDCYCNYGVRNIYTYIYIWQCPINRWIDVISEKKFEMIFGGTGWGHGQGPSIVLLAVGRPKSSNQLKLGICMPGLGMQGWATSQPSKPARAKPARGSKHQGPGPGLGTSQRGACVLRCLRRFRTLRKTRP
jgi:hypothetical protein